MADPAVQDIVGMSGGGNGIGNGWMMVRLKPLSERKEPASVVGRPTAPADAARCRVATFGCVSRRTSRCRAVSDGSSYDYMLLASEVQTLRTWAPRVAGAEMKLPELVDVDAPPTAALSRSVEHRPRGGAAVGRRHATIS